MAGRPGAGRYAGSRESDIDCCALNKQNTNFSLFCPALKAQGRINHSLNSII